MQQPVSSAGSVLDPGCRPIPIIWIAGMGAAREDSGSSPSRHLFPEALLIALSSFRTKQKLWSEDVVQLDQHDQSDADIGIEHETKKSCSGVQGLGGIDPINKS